MSENFKLNNFNCSKVAILAIFTTIVFLLTCAFGEGISGSFGANSSCFKYLGCTEGFFGYDALEHFLFGIAAVFIITWIFQKFPKYSILHTERLKNVLTIIALVTLFSVIWEFVECAHDYFRIDILHQSLINFKLHTNYLDQPTNIDTMGDLASGLAGSIVALLFTKI